jgi:hypothetical protein
MLSGSGVAASTKSQRSAKDNEAALGVATTRLDERLLASLGKLQVTPISFEAVNDVSTGGVCCARYRPFWPWVYCFWTWNFEFSPPLSNGGPG